MSLAPPATMRNETFGVSFFDALMVFLFLNFEEVKMISTTFILLGSAVLIYLSCELFVNSIEWVGKRFGIAKSAVGSILAAFGTALPESVVTLIAVVFGSNAAQKDVGVGAALGGPLVLSTIAYAFVGWSLILFRKKRSQGTVIELDNRKLGRDQLWFLAIFFFKVALGYVMFSWKSWTGLLFLAAYAFYFYSEIRAKDADSENEELEPLRFQPKHSEPHTFWIIIQTVFSLGLIFLGSHIFVGRLETLSLALGVPAHIVSLLLSPIATELPEIVNVLIWVRQGKEQLAFGNISGAMMIQATVPSALGIFFTPWMFDRYLTFAAIATVVSIGYLWLTLRKERISAGRLSFAAVFYLIFAASFIIW
jgi:cation:H+ antiporter